MLGVFKNLAVPVLLRIRFIDRFAKRIFLDERKLFRYDLVLVPILIVSEALIYRKMKTRTTEVTNGGELAVDEKRERTYHVRRETMILQPMSEISILVNIGVDGIVQVE